MASQKFPNRFGDIIHILIPELTVLIEDRR